MNMELGETLKMAFTSNIFLLTSLNYFEALIQNFIVMFLKLLSIDQQLSKFLVSKFNMHIIKLYLRCSPDYSYPH